jgi:radical SAM superfamily enzyme YgiQ (UPF0313 family)
MSWQRIARSKRYLKSERGTIHKDWGGRLPIALVFPNSYYVGMSSLATHVLYRLWNAQDDLVCERVFVNDLQTRPSRASPSPPLALESGEPLDYFPVIALSISYELDYFNAVSVLRAAGIPPRANERNESHPIIIAGGPALSANPEPLAPMLDAVLIGEIEPVFHELTSALHQAPEGRNTVLAALAQVPGLYVPGLSPPSSQRPAVFRQWLRNLDAYEARSSLFTPDTEFSDAGLIEIARGCGRGCRFCLAGYSFRPPRHRSTASILSQARDLLGYVDKLGLVSAAVSDHPEIDQLAMALRRIGARISVSSMRVDPISKPLVQALAESGTRTLTIAPEAGSERLRNIISKRQTEDDVLRAVELAAHHGFPQLKLYFMLGLPTEDEADVEELMGLALNCASRFPRQVIVNITPFVPKAHTPFQRLAQTSAKTVKRRAAYVKSQLRRKGIGVRVESPAWSEVQGTLARGDHQLAEAVLSVRDITPSSWRAAVSEAGLSVTDLLGARSEEASLPWDWIQMRIWPSSADPSAH